MKKTLFALVLLFNFISLHAQHEEFDNLISGNRWYSGKISVNVPTFQAGRTSTVSLLLINKTNRNIAKSKIIIDMQEGFVIKKNQETQFAGKATPNSMSKVDYALKLPDNAPPMVTFNFKVVNSRKRTGTILLTTFGVITTPLIFGYFILKNSEIVHRKNYEYLQFTAPLYEPSKVSVNNNEKKNKTTKSKTYGASDVDLNIPVVAKKNENRFALIIGNEDYSEFQEGLNVEANVIFAKNDSRVFKEYCHKTLGVPETNITYMENATAGKMIQAMDKINKLIKLTEGQAEVFVYYAGHGLPEEKTKAPYLIPVDISGGNLTGAIKLESLFQKLSEFPSKRITVFLDACFSGGAREQGLIAGRSVKIKPKENDVQGNLLVFSAVDGEQIALPYMEQGHGLFTYFLLKKLQETEGNITYSELYKYLQKQVSVKSLLINEKEQSPQVNVSSAINDDWKKWKLR